MHPFKNGLLRSCLKECSKFIHTNREQPPSYIKKESIFSNVMFTSKIKKKVLRWTSLKLYVFSLRDLIMNNESTSYRLRGIIYKNTYLIKWFISNTYKEHWSPTIRKQAIWFFFNGQWSEKISHQRRYTDGKQVCKKDSQHHMLLGNCK